MFVLLVDRNTGSRSTPSRFERREIVTAVLNRAPNRERAGAPRHAAHFLHLFAWFRHSASRGRLASRPSAERSPAQRVSARRGREKSRVEEEAARACATPNDGRALAALVAMVEQARVVSVEPQKRHTLPEASWEDIPLCQ